MKKFTLKHPLPDLCILMNESQGCNATLKTFYLLQFPASWHSKKTMNIQSDKYISKSSETLNNDQNFSGVKQSCHRYGLNNQALQLFEHFRQSAYRQDASYNAHNMRLSSILGNGLYSDVESPTTQTFVPFPRTHGYSSDIADAYAYRMKQMQENLTKFINHSDTMQEQSRMPSRIQIYNIYANHHNTTVPSAYDPRLNEFQTCIHRWF